MFDPPGQRVNPKWVLVQTRDLSQLFPAGSSKIGAGAHSDFLKGLQAVGHERGTNDEHSLNSFFRQAQNFVVRVWL